MNKRRVIQLVLLLLLLISGGAILNVVVAWGCVVFTPMTIGVEMSDSDAAYLQRLIQNAFVNDNESLLLVSHSTAATMDVIDAVIFDDSNQDRATGFRLAAFTRAGFPRRSIISARPVVNEPPLFKRSVVFDANGRGYALRVGIVPADFAINTIFYAAILWAMFAVPLALRRRRRVQCGLCPTCAYPVGASPVCTECGSRFPSSLRGRVREGVERVASRNAQNEVERPTHPLAPSLKGGGKDSA